MGALPDNSETRTKLEDEIKKLETTNGIVQKPSIPSVRLDEISYAAPTDETLRRQAEQSLAEYKAQQENAIRENSDRNAAALAAKREEYVSGKDGETRVLGAAFETAAKNIDNDVLKRGLARSTIAATQKSELEKEYAGRAAEIASDYDKKIRELDTEISLVGAKLDAALNDFNLSYAAKLTQSLDKLKNERDEKLRKVTEYNNSVREKQAKLDADRLKTENDLYLDAIKLQKQATSVDNLSAEERNAVYSAVFDKMDEYLSGMSAEQARLELRNHTLYRDHLSDYYFYKLYDKYGR